MPPTSSGTGLVLRSVRMNTSGTLQQFAKVNVERPEFASVVPRGDPANPGLPGSLAHYRRHCGLHGSKVETVDHDLVHRVHPLGQLALHRAAERRAVGVVGARLQGLVLATNLA